MFDALTTLLGRHRWTYGLAWLFWQRRLSRLGGTNGVSEWQWLSVTYRRALEVKRQLALSSFLSSVIDPVLYQQSNREYPSSSMTMWNVESRTLVPGDRLSALNIKPRVQTWFSRMTEVAILVSFGPYEQKSSIFALFSFINGDNLFQKYANGGLLCEKGEFLCVWPETKPV